MGLKTLRGRDFPRLSQWISLITCVLKIRRRKQKRRGPRDELEDAAGEIRSVRGKCPTVAGFEGVGAGPQAKECGWLLEPLNSPQLTAVRNGDHASPATRNRILPTTGMSNETVSPLEPPGRNTPCRHLNFSSGKHVLHFRPTEL